MQAARRAAVGRRSPAITDPSRRRPLLWFGIAAALVILADQLSKAVVVDELTPGSPVDVIGHWLQLDLTRNSGAAFSIGTGSTLLFTAAAVAVAIVIARTASRINSSRWGVSLGLLFGGALGNLSDRLFRAPAPFRGRVVDWIQVPHWPVFNLADSAITIGVLCIVGLSLLGVEMAKPPQDMTAEPTDLSSPVP